MVVWEMKGRALRERDELGIPVSRSELRELARVPEN
jgi:hypothetical protein